MLVTGCGCPQAPFFTLSSEFTVLWRLARKLIPMEITSSKNENGKCYLMVRTHDASLRATFRTRVATPSNTVRNF